VFLKPGETEEQAIAREGLSEEAVKYVHFVVLSEEDAATF